MMGALRVYFERHLQTLIGSLGRMTRAPFATLMTIAVITIALALPACLQLLVTNARMATGDWGNALDISVYFKTGVREEKVEQLARAARERPEVAEVLVISADAALKEFTQFSGFGTALEALTENPLPHTLIVRPRADPSTPLQVEALKRYLGNWPEVERVQLDTEWVNRFHSMLDLLRRIVLLAGTLLGIGVIVIVGNTIRLDIDNRRTEIEVTKLVGGSDAFVRRPFLYSGFWYGFAGGLLAWGLIGLGVWLLRAPVDRLAELYGSNFHLEGPDLRATLILLGIGTALGWVGSWLATARHLRSIEPTA
jgi:cell division transport system permease protein